MAIYLVLVFSFVLCLVNGQPPSRARRPPRWARRDPLGVEEMVVEEEEVKRSEGVPVTRSTPSFVQPFTPPPNVTFSDLQIPTRPAARSGRSPSDNRTVWPKDVYAYCYPFEKEDILERCWWAGPNLTAAGVYMPMMKEMGTPHPDDWYAAMEEMKKNSSVSIVGVAYDFPRWESIEEIWDGHPNLFDGVMIEWIGETACINNMKEPSESIVKKLTSGKAGSIRYFFRQQDPKLCNISEHDFVRLDDHSKSFTFPEYILPIFACMDGYEGECYKAFTHPDYAAGHCDASKQRYAFNPYEDAGGRMYNLLNDTCSGLPDHDLYGSI